MKKLLLLTFAMLFLVPSVLSICTVEFDKTFPDNYNPSSTITVTRSCSEVTEKNTPYTFTWTNETGSTLEVDSGTTPNSVGVDFFDTYVIASDYLGNITGTLTGTDLEGNATANVSGSNIYSLVINDAFFSPYTFIGNIFAVDLEVADENGKSLNNAHCKIYATDNNDAPLQTCGESYSHNGRVTCDGILSNEFVEGIQYLAKVQCSCGIGDNVCIDSDGGIVNASGGSNTYPFIVSTWLDVNTLTGKSEYFPKEEIFICANITNIEYSRRIPLEIYHQVRCSSREDNAEDLDRALIISDDQVPDLRGISSGVTQMQCKRFVIPEARYLSGKTSECYASTNVWVLNEHGEKIKGYFTTSPIFNITSDTLNIQADWEKIEDYMFNAIINLSAKGYTDYNGSGIGEIDIRLNKVNTETLDHAQQYGSTIIDFNKMIDVLLIKNLTVRNITGDIISSGIEFLEDGLVELELRNIDISTSGWYNVSLEFNSFDERSTEALEGIENKTGTFRLNVDCPAQGIINDPITCTISAQLEDPQLVKGETGFTCYILSNGIKYAETSFLKMITKEISLIEKDFLIPSYFDDDTEHVLQCHADYFPGIGSRRDSFFDTFTAIEVPPIGSAGGVTAEESITEKIIDKIKDIAEEIAEIKEGKINKTILILIICIAIFLTLIAIIFWFTFRKKRKQ